MKASTSSTTPRISLLSIQIVLLVSLLLFQYLTSTYCCNSKSLTPSFTFKSTRPTRPNTFIQNKNKKQRSSIITTASPTMNTNPDSNTSHNNDNDSLSSPTFMNTILGGLPLINYKNALQQEDNTNNNQTPSTLPTTTVTSTTSKQSSISFMNILPKLMAITIPTSVILTLAMNNEDMGIIFISSSSDPSSSELDYVLLEKGLGELENLGNNILDAALPSDVTSLLSIALGEGLAGILGAVVTIFVNLGLKSGMINSNSNSNSNSNINSSINNELLGEDGSSLGRNENTSWSKKNGVIKFLGKDNTIIDRRSKQDGQSRNQNMYNEKNDGMASVDTLFNEALADSDYFLTRAAASPLIGAFGMTGGLASTLTVLLATVPYEFIKLNARAREQKIKEDLYLDTLLEKQQQQLMIQQSWYQQLSVGNKKGEVVSSQMVNQETPMEMGYRFDFVEIFADVCKWLEYDVLMKDFGGKLRWASTGLPVNPGVESAAFGFLAALSSQIYADVIYSVSDSMGNDTKRNEVRSRSINDYIRIYSLKCLSASILFGVYEGTRIPVTRFINGFLSGGYGSCIGSADFDFCLDTYLLENPAVATPEAQLRSFAVATVSLFDRLGDITNENVDTAGLIRSLAVQLYSLIGF